MVVLIEIDAVKSGWFIVYIEGPQVTSKTYINTSFKDRRIRDAQSCVITNVYDLLGQSSNVLRCRTKWTCHFIGLTFNSLPATVKPV